MGKRPLPISELEREVRRKSRAVRRAKARLGRKPDHPRNISRLIAATVYAIGFKALPVLRSAFAATDDPRQRDYARKQFHYELARIRQDRAMWLRRGGGVP